MILNLPSLEATAALAAAVAAQLVPPFPAFLLQGQLGAGKTTFIRSLVESLPGGDAAEVSSPSFNIMNIYPTRPPVAHFDLYRTSGFGIGDDLEEILASPEYLHLLEWAEYLPGDLLPENFLAMSWVIEEDVRIVTLNATGPTAQRLVDGLKDFAPHD